MNEENMKDGAQPNQQPPAAGQSPAPPEVKQPKKAMAAKDPVAEFHVKHPAAPSGESNCGIMVGDAVAQVALMDGCPVRVAAVNYEPVPDGFRLTVEDLLKAGFVRY